MERVEYLYHVGCPRFLHSILQAGLIAGGKDVEEGRQTVFFTALDPMSGEPEEEYQDLSRPRKVQYKSKWKIIQDAIFWTNLKKAQDKGLQFWQTRSHALSFTTLCQLTALEEWRTPTCEVILNQRTSTPRPPPKIILREGWQVQHEDHSQRGSAIGKPAADEIDLRVQGVPQ